MSNHQPLKDEFAFDDFYEVPAIGNSGGIVWMWLSHIVHVSLVDRTNQEVHSRIQVFGKYLGFPILNHQPRAKDFQYIIDNMENKLANWKTNFLTPMGRLTLIRSTLNAIPAYTMQYFSLPASTCQTIDKIQKDFLWGSTTDKQKMHYVSLETCTLPRANGGLGLSTAKTKNRVLLTGLSWRLFTNPNALWTRALVSSYNYPNTCKTSFIWKNILQGGKICAPNIAWKPNSGTTVSFWLNRWIPDSPPLRHLLYGPLTKAEYCYHLSDVWDGTSWNWNKLTIPIPDDLKDKAAKARLLPTLSIPDLSYWAASPNGIFSSHSVYLYLSNKEPHPVTFTWIWKLNPINKYKFTLWLCFLDRLPTFHYLNRLTIAPTPICPICHAPVDAELHALLKGLELVVQHNYHPIEIEVDSLELLYCLDTSSTNFNPDLSLCSFTSVVLINWKLEKIEGKIVHPSLVPTNRELKMPFFLTLQSVQTLSDPKVIDRIKIELFGATAITRKIVLEGGLVVVNSLNGDGAVGGSSGAAVGANDAPLTIFKINHYEYDHIGYIDFTFSSKCFGCKCQDCKVKHDVVINAINALTASVKELTSKRSSIPSKRILYPSTPLEIKAKRRRKVTSKALSSIQKSKIVTPLSVFFIEQCIMAKEEQHELKKMNIYICSN
ncbi:hypothetical protein FXO38_29486 [Capsicum annuum]|uniref:Reverse transcriptase zinc-binding domain-containing protein n=1 Tax=Capsicum annuum TaxID=4072 RepID=A0A2G2ZVF6_CAPAN|nr:hypothetical protein FXO38_29486 [Capsicum annuum]PHT85963.1 hypothetical protein T459_08069 [Capsicum annuum]